MYCAQEYCKLVIRMYHECQSTCDVIDDKRIPEVIQEFITSEGVDMAAANPLGIISHSCITFSSFNTLNKFFQLWRVLRNSVD